MDDSSTPTSSAEGQSALAGRLHRMIDETDRLLTSAAATGDQKFQGVRDKLVEQMRQMRTQLADYEEIGRQKAKDAARVTDETVHAHPYGAMAVAAAAGFLIGILATTRR